MAEELNKFYSRFDIYDFNNELSNFRNGPGPAGCKIQMGEVAVCKSFGRIKEKKKLRSCWHNGKDIEVLCLAPVLFFSYFFQSSLEQQKAPSMLKGSIVVLMAKVKSPKA